MLDIGYFIHYFDSKKIILSFKYVRNTTVRPVHAAMMLHLCYLFWAGSCFPTVEDILFF